MIQPVSSQWHSETLDGLVLAASKNFMKYYGPADLTPERLIDDIAGYEGKGKSEMRFDPSESDPLRNNFNLIRIALRTKLWRAVYFDEEARVVGAIAFKLSKSSRTGIEVIAIGSLKPGVGRMLMRYVIRQAAQLDGALEVESLEEAAPFYEKLGLEKKDKEEEVLPWYGADPRKVMELTKTV